MGHGEDIEEIEGGCEMNEEYMIEYDKKIYHLAHEFLLDFSEINENIINKQLEEVDNKITESLDDVFFRFMESLQNANMKANVIGKSIKGIENLKKVIPTLKSMDSFKDENALLEKIFEELKPKSNKNVIEHQKDNKSIWKRYVKSLFETREFMRQFSNIQDFKQWVEFFNDDDRARPALPMILSNEIYGLGFALSCDFLKEIGYLNFGKPDVHIKYIFYELGLSKSKNDYNVLKDIVRIAKNVGSKPYHVDKLFWLVGSGKFYLSDIEIGRQREKFVEYVRNRLNARGKTSKVT